MMPSSTDSPDEEEEDRSSRWKGRKEDSMIVGVVEGFYGRPWTMEQRKDLFAKMEAQGLNSYLYAPKDDCKHRAYWREPYTVEEAEHLSSLIRLASGSHVEFYYAISPGLDICYSNPKDVAFLKRKLDQVSRLGCKAFALLFDDIEPEMSKQDKEVFQSFGHAQVAVTNDIYEHFDEPKFLFCPTQYCTARAFPSIRTSEYLITIGAKLAPDIQIMWTGDKVISKTITEKTLEDISDVLRRPVVIWDNLHANDYDQKRVFLGPFSGRSPEMINKLGGVMTNPNCEYGANYVAIHTLAQWSKCKVDGESSTVSADIKLEIEADSSSVTPLPCYVYHPHNALRSAIKDWKKEFSKQKSMWGPLSKPQVGLSQPTLVPSVNTCMATTNPTVTSQIVNNNGNQTSPPPQTGISDSQDRVGGDSLFLPPDSQLTPASMPLMNSLVASDKVVVDHSLLLSTANNQSSVIPSHPPQDLAMSTPGNSSASSCVLPNGAHPSLEPMDQDQLDLIKSQNSDIPMESLTNPPTPASIMQQEDNEVVLHKTESTTMLCDELPTHNPEVMSCEEGVGGRATPLSPVPRVSAVAESEDHISSDEPTPIPSHLINSLNDQDFKNELEDEDLIVLCQLFFLPAEHGKVGLDLLNDFFWLKRHGSSMTSGSQVTPEDRDDWNQRAEKFLECCRHVQTIFDKLCRCQNRELVYDLYTYVWDMCTVVQTLEAFVLWLAKGSCSSKAQNFVVGQQTWFSGVREAFISGDHEPWVFRGGLASDLQRLLPMDSGQDLYNYKHPDIPTPIFYRIRPFNFSDSNAVYSLICEVSEEEKDLLGDKTLGGYLTLSSSHCFVCEANDGQVIGFILGVPDVLDFKRRYEVAYLPEMVSKYPDEPESSFYLPEEPQFVSKDSSPWGRMTVHVNRFITEQSLNKRMTMLALAAFRASGTVRAYVRVPVADVHKREEYISLGFSIVNPEESGAESTEQFFYLIRSF